MSEPTVQAIAAAGTETVIDKIDDFLTDRSLTREQVSEVYNRWSESYDEDVSRVPLGYNNPRQLASAFVETLPPSADKQALRILDVACGTGKVGENLWELGFRHIDGLDGSAKMQEVARRKGVYENLFVEFIGDQPLKFAPARTYDAVLTTGSFCPNHLAPSCLKHLGALVKPGGFVGIAMRKEFCVTDPALRNMEPELLKLKSEGLWDIALWEERPKYYGDLSGMFYFLRVK